MKSEIESALKPRPSDEVLVEGFRIQIKRQDMSTLSGLNWLNDEVCCHFFLFFFFAFQTKKEIKTSLTRLFNLNF